MHITVLAYAHIVNVSVDMEGRMAAMIEWQGISRTNNILSNPNLVTIGIGKCQSRASPRPLTSTCSCRSAIVS
jgi:hypothetical protein